LGSPTGRGRWDGNDAVEHRHAHSQSRSQRVVPRNYHAERPGRVTISRSRIALDKR
jgi:hypothetical protein